MSEEDRRAVSDNPSADVCLTLPRTLRSALALENAKNTDNRRVTFPEDDTRLVTGYLEPVTPWSAVDEITNDELITEYTKSCEKHLTQPIQTILDQLKVLGIIDGVRRGRLSIKGFPLSAPACEALEAIFKRVRFNRLELRECQLTDETAVALFDMVEYYESASELDISGNHEFGILGWAACSRMIHKSQCLEQLKACETSLAENTAPALGRSLRNPCNLRCLHLQRSKLAGRPLLCLAGYLKQNKSVRELHLGDNELRADDAQCLASMLKGNYSLQLLDVSNNDIQDSGIESIAEALAEQSALNSPSSGSSSDSPMSSPQSASSGSVQERGLAVLIVWNNNLTRNSGQHFSKALTRCRSLEVLNVGQNPLGGETVNRIKGALQKNRSLLSLGMQSARLGAEAAIALAEVIEDNPVIQRIDLRDNRLQVAGLLALATALRNNRGVTRIDLDDAPTPPNGTADDRHPIEETRLVAEIRTACKRNLDSPAAPLARKISLTCQTLQATRVPIPEILTPTHLSPPRSQSRPLRSPLPSPIPSPAGSPVPSPSKSSRFKVSRVVDNKEQKSNRFSVIRNVNLTSDCNRSDPEIFANAGGARIDVELCICCKSRSTDDLTRNVCQCRGVNTSKSDENLCDKIPDGNILRKSASVCVAQDVNKIQEVVLTHESALKNSALDSPDLEISRVMMNDFEEIAVMSPHPVVEITDFNKADDINSIFIKETKKSDNFNCDTEFSKCEARRSILSASSNESSMESSTFEAVSTSQYSNQLNSSVSSNESVSPNMFGKHMKLHGSVTSLEASVSSVDSLKSSNGNNVFNFNSDDKLPSESCHSNVDSGFESKMIRNESLSSNEGTLTSGCNLRSNVFSSPILSSMESTDDTLTDCDKTRSILLELPDNSSPKNTPRSRKICWVAPYNPNPVPFHPKAEIVETVVEPIKPPTNLEKLLSIFQHPGSLFLRNTDSSNAEKKITDISTSASNTRRDSQGSNTNSFWSWGLGSSSNSNSNVSKTVVPVVSATVDKLKRFGESFESTSSHETNLDSFYSSSVSAEYTLRLAEGRSEIEPPIVNKDDVKKTVERIVQKDNLMDDDKSLSIDDLSGIINTEIAITPSESCSELMERQIFNVPLEAVPENVSISPKPLEECKFDVNLSQTAEHDSSPPLLERHVSEDNNQSRVHSNTDVLFHEYDECINLHHYGFGRNIEIVPQTVMTKDPNYVLERLAIADVMGLDKKPIVTTEIVLENRLAGGGSGVSPNLQADTSFCDVNNPFSHKEQSPVKNDIDDMTETLSRTVSEECDIVFNPTLALGGSDLHRQLLISQINLQNEIGAVNDTNINLAENDSVLTENCDNDEPNVIVRVSDHKNESSDTEFRAFTDIQTESVISVGMEALNVTDNANSDVTCSVHLDSEVIIDSPQVLSAICDRSKPDVNSIDILPVATVSEKVTVDEITNAASTLERASDVKTNSARVETVNCDNNSEVIPPISLNSGNFCLLPEEGEQISSYIDKLISEARDICIERLSNRQDSCKNIYSTNEILPSNSTNLVDVLKVDKCAENVCREECKESIESESNICKSLLEKNETISVLSVKMNRGFEIDFNPEVITGIGEKYSNLEDESSQCKRSTDLTKNIGQGPCDKTAEMNNHGSCDIKNAVVVHTADIVQNEEIVHDLIQNAAIRPLDLQPKNKMAYSSILKQSIGLENKVPMSERQLSPETGPSVDNLPSKIIRRIKENISPENTLTPSMSNTQTLAKELLENRSVLGMASILENPQQDEFIAKLFGKLDDDDDNKDAGDAVTEGFNEKKSANSEIPNSVLKTVIEKNVSDMAVESDKLDLPSKIVITSSNVEEKSKISDVASNIDKISNLGSSKPSDIDTSLSKVGKLKVGFTHTDELFEHSKVNLESKDDILKLCEAFSLDTSNIEVVAAEEFRNVNNPLVLSSENVVLTPTFVDQAKDALADIVEDGSSNNTNIHQNKKIDVAIIVDESSPLAADENIRSVADEHITDDVNLPIEIATAVDACTISEGFKSTDACLEAYIAHDVSFDDVFLPCTSKGDKPKVDISGSDTAKSDISYKPVSILKNKNVEISTNTSSPKDIPDIRKKKPYPNYDRTHPIPSKKSSHDGKNLPLRCGSLPETSSPRSLNPNVTPVGSRSPVGGLGGTIGKLARDSLYALNVSDEDLDRIRFGGQASMESVASLGSVSEDVSQDDECEVSSSSSLLMSVTMETGDE